MGLCPLSPSSACLKQSHQGHSWDLGGQEETPTPGSLPTPLYQTLPSQGHCARHTYKLVIFIFFPCI